MCRKKGRKEEKNERKQINAENRNKLKQLVRQNTQMRWPDYEKN